MFFYKKMRKNTHFSMNKGCLRDLKIMWYHRVVN